MKCKTKCKIRESCCKKKLENYPSKLKQSNIHGSIYKYIILEIGKLS